MEGGPFGVSPGASAAMIGGAGVLLLALLWAEYRRPDRRRRAPRLIATALVVGSLLVIGLRPQWTEARPDVAEALLVTPGATEVRLTNLADSLGADLPVFTYGVAPAEAAAFDHVEPIPDPSALARRRPGVRRLVVGGHGLTDPEWHGLDHVRVIPLLSPPDDGLHHVSWPRSLPLGADLVVQGRVEGIDDAPFHVVLSGPGIDADSVALDTPDAAFTLRTRSRAVGRGLYRLVVRGASGEVHGDEKIAVSVVEPRPLSVLVLESAPGFETRFLKSWMAEGGNRLAIRSTISVDRFRSDVLNLPALDLRTLTPNLLARFDVLWIDAPSLRQLSSAERQAIREAVERDGLGVLVAPDVLLSETPLPSSADARFYDAGPLRALDDPSPRVVLPRWRRASVPVETPVPALPYVFSSSGVMPPLLTDAAGGVLGVQVLRGAGRMGVSLVEETYRWVLAGEQEAHAAYWSHLLSALARPPDVDRWTWPQDRPLREDHPVAFTLTTSSPEPAAAVETEFGARIRLPLRRDALDDTRWRSVFWPDRPGWHRVAASGAGAWFYVDSGEAWRSFGQAVRVNDTRRRALFAPREAVGEEARTVRRPVPLWPFFVIILLGSVFLWMEGKG